SYSATVRFPAFQPAECGHRPGFRTAQDAPGPRRSAEVTAGPVRLEPVGGVSGETFGSPTAHALGNAADDVDTGHRRKIVPIAFTRQIRCGGPGSDDQARTGHTRGGKGSGGEFTVVEGAEPGGSHHEDRRADLLGQVEQGEIAEADQ